MAGVKYVWIVGGQHARADSKLILAWNMNKILTFEEAVKKGLEEVASASYNKGFCKGAITIIDILEEAMRLSNSKVVYPKWLETSREEINKWKEKKHESTK